MKTFEIREKSQKNKGVTSKITHRSAVNYLKLPNWIKINAKTYRCNPMFLCEKYLNGKFTNKILTIILEMREKHRQIYVGAPTK